MKFRAERQEFAEAVGWVLRTVGTNRTALATLAGVRLEVAGDRLHLRSSDNEIDSQLSIPVQAERPGLALISGRLLGEVVRTLPNAAVAAEANGDRLRLACGRARFDLRLMPDPEDFPVGSLEAEEPVAAVLKADEFARTVNQVARAASAETARPVLTGVQVTTQDGRLTAAATDSYRLAVRSVPWEQGTQTSLLVPRRALEMAGRSAEMLGSEVRLVAEAAHMTFVFSDRRLRTRLIDGRFPDYRQLIPAGYERRLVVDRDELTRVVKRVSVVREDRVGEPPVTLHLTTDAIRVTAGSGEVGQAEESLPGELEGEDLEIAFNPRYLTDGLDAAGSESVVLEFRDELKPAVLRQAPAEGETPQGDFLYLLMPVRV